QFEVAGVPAIVLRIGFVGELGYEFHVPTQYGVYVWKSILEAGEEFGIKPFGVEAQRRLRLDKKHILPGHDTDVLTNPRNSLDTLNMGPVALDVTITRRTFSRSSRTGVTAPASSLARIAKTYGPKSSSGVVQNLPLSSGAPYHDQGDHSASDSSAVLPKLASTAGTLRR
ncbi:MAG: hypothetical protein IH969_05525, partial [Candidatus Krumholzibacteriota bacterium]|nr:hypothetical protein [Candidatus Krumholzibacteriota bacterium]